MKKNKNTIGCYFLFVLSLALLFSKPLWAISWARIDTGYSYNFTGIWFCDDNRGVIVGARAILRTTDGGNSWNIAFEPNPARNFFAVDGSGEIFYALADSGHIYRSINCGQTWNLEYELDHNLFAMAFNAAGGPEKLVLTGDHPGEIVHISDGVVTVIPPPVSEVLNSVYFRSADNGYIVGENGTVLTTNDGGLTWASLVSPGEDLYLRHIYASSASNIFITEESGNLCTSTLGGWAWSVRTVTPGVIYKRIFFGSNRLRMVGTQGKIVVSSDRGQTWREEASGTNNTLNDIIYLPYTRKWFAVGSNGTLLKGQQGRFINR